MCQHKPSCPSAKDTDREVALVIAARPDHGWSRLCSGVLLFDDSGKILPNVPRRLAGPITSVAA
jgi:hypothetical protein